MHNKVWASVRFFCHDEGMASEIKVVGKKVQLRDIFLIP
jgi:predicted ester cyclase